MAGGSNITFGDEATGPKLDLASLLQWLADHNVTTSGHGNGSGANFSWDAANLNKGRIANHPEKILGLMLCIFGILANGSSVVAIVRVRGSMSANFRLILSLCVSDMFVCISILLNIAQREISLGIARSSRGSQTCFSLLIRIIWTTSQAASLLNLVGLALDHYFAIVRPLNHNQLMSGRRAVTMISIFWGLSLAIGLTHIYVPLGKYTHCKNSNVLNYCEYIMYCTEWHIEYLMFTLTIISFILMVFIYGRICVQIRRYQNFHGRHVAKSKQNRRGLVTTVCIVGTFAVCYLPYCLFESIVTILITAQPLQVMYYMGLIKKWDFHLFNLVLMNSICDPVIYAVRMREVQRSYRQMFRVCSSDKRRLKNGFQISFDRNSTTNMPTTVTKDVSTFL